MEQIFGRGKSRKPSADNSSGCTQTIHGKKKRKNTHEYTGDIKDKDPDINPSNRPRNIFRGVRHFCRSHSQNFCAELGEKFVRLCLRLHKATTEGKGTYECICSLDEDRPKPEEATFCARDIMVLYEGTRVML